MTTTETSETALGLGALIRSVLRESPSADPSSLVDEVLDRMPAESYREMLRQAVLARMASEIGHLRASATPAIRKGVSTKQSLIRDEYWPTFLRQRVLVADGYKFLADTTPADLRWLAAQRRSQAKELTDRANEFGALADVMDRDGVARLGDMDASTGSEVMGRAA